MADASEEEQVRSFAAGKDARNTLEALAVEQGVEAADDFDALLGDFWPQDEDADEFVTALRAWRREQFPEGTGPRAS